MAEKFEWGRGLSPREVFWGRFMAVSGLVFGVVIGLWIGAVLWA